MKSPLANNTLFYVVAWNNSQVLATHASLSAAKKDAKSRGTESGFAGTLMPIAFVAADCKDYDYQTRTWSETQSTRCLIYNPHFK